jgi:hypothetical protein
MSALPLTCFATHTRQQLSPSLVSADATTTVSIAPDLLHHSHPTTTLSIACFIRHAQPTPPQSAGGIGAAAATQPVDVRTLPVRQYLDRTVVPVVYVVPSVAVAVFAAAVVVADVVVVCCFSSSRLSAV